MQVNDLVQILDDFIQRENNTEIARLAREIREARSNKAKLDDLVVRMGHSLAGPSTDPYLEKSPSTNFLLACSSYLLGSPDAIEYAERGEHLYSLLGSNYNEAISKWLLGLFYWEDSQVERARENIDNAIAIISSLAKSRHLYGFYNEYKNYLDVMQDLKQFRGKLENNPSQSTDASEIKPISEPFTFQPSDGLAGVLTIYQIPTYTSVQAGANGPIWTAAPSGNGHTETDELIIGDRRFHIFSVKQGERKIALVPKRRYGWAEVEGNSMNMAQPTRILAGNMVMFYEANDAPENAIVIASFPIHSGAVGYSFVIKRWKKFKMEFVSETSEPGHTPIPCDEECKIIGIVVAVAKPSSPDPKNPL